MAFTYSLNVQQASSKTTRFYRIRIALDNFTEVTGTHARKSCGQQGHGYNYNHYPYTIVSSRRCESYGKSGHSGYYN